MIVSCAVQEQRILVIDYHSVVSRHLPGPFIYDLSSNADVTKEKFRGHIQSLDAAL